MKKNFLKVLLCSITICLFLNSKTNAQYIVNGKEVDTSFNTSMNHIFGNLDKSKIPFGLLRDYAMEFTNLENFNGLALTAIYYARFTQRWQPRGSAALPIPLIYRYKYYKKYYL
jgi:hypothetical protein